MHITQYHAKYYAHELTKKSAANSPERLASVLSDAKVDLNPHQIEAALFPFKSPFSKGVLLADEVGLGKTIEAGLVIAQRWAELKRKILIIVPANLRKQWNQELLEKFYINSQIIDGNSFKESVNNGNKNPFDVNNEIVICSYNFAYNKIKYLENINWDLVVIDEAHRLRNVYKKENKIAKTIKEGLKHTNKLLLTATPLQNSLLELYGLTSVIDEYNFGDFKSFKYQYSRLSNNDVYAELKDRLKPICHRTLRRQVLEYIKFTNRHSITQKFIISENEQVLHDWILDYLRRDKLYAFPERARHLITLVLLKLLSSSTFAIAGTLDSLVIRLTELMENQTQPSSNQLNLQEDFETYEEIDEEWKNDNNDRNNFSDIDFEKVKEELEEVKKYRDFAKSITKNSKGEALLPALKVGFEKAHSLGAERKAVIFTESRRTQKYLFDLLQNTEHKGKVITFNGTNEDSLSSEIYAEWLKRHQGTDKVSGSKSADKRAAIIDYFKESAEILVATEAAAEGINLQFCSMVVNYDLPWNPQRVEQRIGRCHRYGQKFDVVVVNFLNENNLADVRIYELLKEKFQLFDGVFGASDEILGSIESGIDLEKRIVDIYKECRTEDEINRAFDQLQTELETTISEKIKETRQAILENFDEEVHERLKTNMRTASDYLSKFDKWLWEITSYYLKDCAEINNDTYSFDLKKNPFKSEPVKLGTYFMNKYSEDGYIYRIGHQLAKNILSETKEVQLPIKKLNFDYSNQLPKITVLEDLLGKTGYLMLSKLKISSLEEEDNLIFIGIDKDGGQLSHEQCSRLFSLKGDIAETIIPNDILNSLEDSTELQKKRILVDISERNADFFESEMDKLDRWAEDKRKSLKVKLKELDERIKELKKKARLAPNLPKKLEIRKKVRNLELKRDKYWVSFEKESKNIEKEKDELIDKIEKKLNQSTSIETLFTIEWEVV